MALGRITGQMLSANLARSGTDLTFETNLLALDVSNSRVGIGTASPATTLHVSATDSLRLPSGTTGQRPGSPANGDIRYNTTIGTIEGYAGGAYKNLASGSAIQDADEDTKIQVEESSDEDIIRFDTGGTERFTMSSAGKIAYGTNGGGYIHNATVANSFSLSSENMILAGPVSVSGTITVDSGSTLVVV